MATSQRNTTPDPALPPLIPPYLPLATIPLHLLELTHLSYDAPILHIGAGDPCFVPALLSRAYANVVVVDQDAQALAQLRTSLPAAQAEQVLWIEDNITHPQRIHALDPVLLWHDRTRIHALGTREERTTYVRLLNHMVSAHGWVLFGLPAVQALVQNPAGNTLEVSAQADQWALLLGEDYTLLHVVEEPQLTLPASPASAVYAVFQRNSTSRCGSWLTQ